MADSSQPVPPDDTPEVEAHASVLDLQGVGRALDVLIGACISLTSVAEER